MLVREETKLFPIFVRNEFLRQADSVNRTFLLTHKIDAFAEQIVLIAREAFYVLRLKRVKIQMKR